jgi:nicotinamidase-related amidase
MKKTLIVVDMQNDFVYGPLGTDEARAIVPNVKKKIEEYRERDDDIIFTLDWHEDYYLDTHEGRYLPVEHCMADTDGSRIVNELEMQDDEMYVTKNAFGTYEWRWYSHIFDGNAELVGVCTDICVVSNALILRSMYPEMDIAVDASCCAGTTPGKHKAALEVMKSCHIDIINE